MNKKSQHKIVNTFSPILIGICFGCSKEPSHWDGSFEYPQHMFWLRNKKKNSVSQPLLKSCYNDLIFIILNILIQVVWNSLFRVFRVTDRIFYVLKDFFLPTMQTTCWNAAFRIIWSGSSLFARVPVYSGIQNEIYTSYQSLNYWEVTILSWVKVFRIIPEFRILRLTFHRKSASKCGNKENIIGSLIYSQSV